MFRHHSSSSNNASAVMRSSASPHNAPLYADDEMAKMKARSEAIAQILAVSFPIKCDKCNTPAAALVGTALIIKHRHHGEQHTTVLNLAELASKLGYHK